MNEKLLSYRGKPLLRSGNVIYYGSMADAYIVMLNITATRADHDAEVPSRISVTLMRTDEKLSLTERIVKSGERTSLYDAIDLGGIWLTKALSGK